MLAENDVQVRRWSAEGEGYAYVTSGTRVIDAPPPRRATAFAWEFTFACFVRFGFAVPAIVTRQVAESMAERLAAALAEGLEPAPPRFQPFEPAARALLAEPRASGYNEIRGERSAPHPPP